MRTLAPSPIRLVFGLTVLLPTVASATNLEVCSFCRYTTIPAAVDAAVDGDAIVIRSTVQELGTIFIDKDLRFVGISNGTIDGRDPYYSFEPLFVISNARVTFDNLTIGNRSGDHNGFIITDSEVTFTNCAISHIHSYDSGGAFRITNSRVGLVGSLVSNNGTEGLYGVAYIFGVSTFNLENSVISNNHGDWSGSCGIVLGSAARMSITNSDITRTYCREGFGHALVNFGEIEITNSFLGNNGALIRNYGILRIIDSTLSSNGWETLRNEPSGDVILRTSTVTDNLYSSIINDGTFRIRSSLIARNLGSWNLTGGIDNRGVMRIDNTTISGNGGDVGGLKNTGDAQLANVTITDNAAGIMNDGYLRAANTIVAQNLGPDCELPSPLTVYPTEPNLDSDGTCKGFSFSPGYAGLGPLQDNGGPTSTHAIDPASDAVDSGYDSVCEQFPVSGFDQRGITRPNGLHCDLGAFELDYNRPPDCTAAHADVDVLWPANKQFQPVSVLGVSDPDGDPVTITVTAILQDEPCDGTADGRGLGTATAELRAERDPAGNGRVYHVEYAADDDQGGFCWGELRVTVPRLTHEAAFDDGPLYDSTVPLP